MRDHKEVPLVDERELYKYAMELERLTSFTWTITGNSLIKTQQIVLDADCYEAAPNLCSDNFLLQLLIGWWHTSDDISDKLIYVRSYRIELAGKCTTQS